MKMSKKEFFRGLGAHDKFYSQMIYAWFDWRKLNFDGDWNPGSNYNAEYIRKTQEIVVTSEKFGEDRFPASLMFTNDPDKVTALWHTAWYDGPLCGVAEFEGQKVWYQVHDGTWDNTFNVWTWDLYQLSDEEYQTELKQHKLYDEDYKQPDYRETNKHLGLFDDCEINWEGLER